MQEAGIFIEVRRSSGGFLQTGAGSFALGRDLPHAIGSLSWKWDGHRLTAETCRYGVGPLFYCCDGDRILLAPSILTLLERGAPAALDETAIGVFARFASFLGDDTPFRSVRMLPPGGRLVWDGTLSIRGDEVAIAPQEMSRPEAIRRYAALFRAAIERTAGQRAIVPLSGGRDSRHIAFEAKRLGRLDRCFTLRYNPPKPDEDFAVARRVAAALDVPCEIIAQSGDRVAQERHASLACDLATNVHYWLLPLEARLAGVTGDAAPLLDGIGGDVLSNGLFLDPERLTLYRAGRLRELADRLLANGPCELSYLRHPGLMPLTPARERLIAELDRHQTAPNPVASFFFWNRTRRCIAPALFGLLAAHRVHCPYLDPELFAFLLGLPPEHFLDHSFHTETIHAAFPGYAAIPFESKDPKPARAFWHLRAYAARLMQRLHHTPRHLLDRRYCLARLAHMAATGNARFLWLAEIISYLGVLEEVQGRSPDTAALTEPAAAPLARAVVAGH